MANKTRKYKAEDMCLEVNCELFKGRSVTIEATDIDDDIFIVVEDTFEELGAWVSKENALKIADLIYRKYMGV